jgi:glycosyltransferase involved in cell wall biosynthesis
VKYSVVTLACNRLEYTIRHIDSVIRNAGQEYEHVVVNNASSDGTREWLDYVVKLPHYRHLKPVHLDENRGIWAGYTAGLDAASADTVLFSDNDIEVHTPNFLAKMAGPVESGRHPISQAYFTATPGWRSGPILDYPVAFFLMHRKNFIRTLKLPDDYARHPLKTYQTEEVSVSHIDGWTTDTPPGKLSPSKVKYPPEVIYDNLVGDCPMGKAPFRKTGGESAYWRANCWILTHERSGSTLLCDLLNNVGADPKFAEHMNRVHGPTYQRFLKDPAPFANCKVMPDQFRFHNMSIKDITSRLPNIKFVHLSRADVYAQAVSMYFCMVTEKWTLSDDPTRVEDKMEWAFETPDKYFDRKVPIPLQSSLLLHAYYETMARHRDFWGQHFLRGQKYIDVDYDDLVADPARATAPGGDFLGLPPA